MHSSAKCGGSKLLPSSKKRTSIEHLHKDSASQSQGDQMIVTPFVAAVLGTTYTPRLVTVAGRSDLVGVSMSAKGELAGSFAGTGDRRVFHVNAQGQPTLVSLPKTESAFLVKAGGLGEVLISTIVSSGQGSNLYLAKNGVLKLVKSEQKGTFIPVGRFESGSFVYRLSKGRSVPSYLWSGQAGQPPKELPISATMAGGKGQIVGSKVKKAGFLSTLPAVWSNGSLTTLALKGYDGGRATAVSSSGLIAAVSSGPCPTDQRKACFTATVWKDGKGRPIGPTLRDTIAEPVGINAKGEVLCSQGSADDGPAILLKPDGTRIDLLTGTRWSQKPDKVIPVGIDDQGRILVAGSTARVRRYFLLSPVR